jgi:hypothetical protein
MTNSIMPDSQHAQPDDADRDAVIPDRPVRIWELLLVVGGAVAIVLFALYELSQQFLRKTSNPEQAQAVVEQVLTYEMPGGSRGLRSLKTNTEAFALVANSKNPPDLLLLVNQSPIEGTPTGEGNLKLADEFNLLSALVGTWQYVRQTKTEQRQFCNKSVMVTIREGTYRLIDAPGKAVQMQEYMMLYPQKTTQSTIQLFAIGPQARQQIDRVFRSFKCPVVK